MKKILIILLILLSTYITSCNNRKNNELLDDLPVIDEEEIKEILYLKYGPGLYGESIPTIIDNVRSKNNSLYLYKIGKVDFIVCLYIEEDAIEQIDFDIYNRYNKYKEIEDKCEWVTYKNLNSIERFKNNKKIAYIYLARECIVVRDIVRNYEIELKYHYYQLLEGTYDDEFYKEIKLTFIDEYYLYFGNYVLIDKPNLQPITRFLSGGQLYTVIQQGVKFYTLFPKKSDNYSKKYYDIIKKYAIDDGSKIEYRYSIRKEPYYEDALKLDTKLFMKLLKGELQ